MQAKKNLRYASEASITLLPTLLSHLLPKFLRIGLSDREVAEGSEAKQNVDRDSPCFSISLQDEEGDLTLDFMGTSGWSLPEPREEDVMMKLSRFVLN